MVKSLLKHLLTLFAGMFFFVSPAVAQELVWDASFYSFFDNREYKNSRTNHSQTMFGARVAPEIGVRWKEHHSLMAGVDLLANFGDKPFRTNTEAIIYYQYHSPKYTAAVGIVPRSKLMGDYSSAFFSDSVRYYDANISGLLLQYRGNRGYIEFGCDWNSMISNENREKFMLFTASRFNFGIGYVGLHATMYHHAGRVGEDDSVVDNVLVYPHAGVNFARITPLDVFNLRVGWLKVFQNDRHYVGEYVKPGGVQVELNIEKWKFGISNTFYAGKNLMPYWIAPEEGLDYGPGLYWGEPFYRTDNIYNRLEAYWAPIQNDKMYLRVSTVHHYDGRKMNWQQKIMFSFFLGQNRIFKKTY